MVPDYMHGVLLGITKHLLQMFFSPSNAGKPYFIGKKIKTISERMCSNCSPDYIESVPHNLEKHYQNLKASELESWLLYYALPCLDGFLNDEYLEHFAKLSEGVHLLLGDTITREELRTAERLLDEFYQDFGKDYGQGSCGLNVHNIGAHLSFYVEEWGPLFAWSCFPF